MASYIKKKTVMAYPRVLFVGPIPPPVHGQSIAFETAFRGYRGKKHLVAHNMTGRSFFSRVVFTQWSILRVFFLLVTKKIDVVYFTCSRSFFGSLFDVAVIYLSYLFGKKTLNHLHGGDFCSFYEHQRGVYKKILRWSYEKVYLSIVLLSSMKEQFVKHFPKMKLEVLANFYDESLDDIDHLDQHSGLRLLFLSNIMQTKGVLELLSAFEGLVKNYPQLTLVVAGVFLGDDQMKVSKIKKVFETKLEDLRQKKHMNVQYMGMVSGEQKVELLKSSDILVFPTYYKSEALPLVILEAMRAGNVIISTKHNYLPDFIGDKNGRLVAPKSVDELKDAIAYFIEHTEERKKIQRYNMQYAKDHYSQNLFEDRLNNIFLHMCYEYL